MILQALVEHYENLVAQGKLDRPGWSKTGISYALYINDAGELEQAVSLKQEAERGKKKVLVPQLMSLPALRRKSSDITANFLWDKSSYVLGISENGTPQRNLQCFNACKLFHHQLLDGVDSPAARALLAFFDQWDPMKAWEHPALMNQPKDMFSKSNLVFRYNGAFLHEDPLIKRVWQEFYDCRADTSEQICLVTGKRAPIAKTHPAILGVGGTNPKLVSFDKNSPAFCSYGKTQGYNAPTSEYAAFAYASALNELLATERDCVRRIEETTVLFWAAGGQQAYQSFPVASLFGVPANYAFSDLKDVVHKICSAKPIDFDETRLNPNIDFFVLGLSPNKGRLSVRFFLKNSFGEFVKKIQEHYKRLYIERTAQDKFDALFLPSLLDEVVKRDSSNKLSDESSNESSDKLHDKLLGDTLRAILTDTQYPASLRNFAHLRIRADRDINRVQASILKANLCKKYERFPQNPIMEALQVNLNENCTYPPYLLGRLFSVMEQIQLASANWEINRTIKDSYFSSVSVTPRMVFSKLFPLNEHHMRKLKRDKFNLARKLESEKNAIIAMLNTPIPTRFTPDETDCFYIGYYHQNCKKENKEKQKEEPEDV